MPPIHLAYLFDVDNYRVTIKPIIERLVLHDFDTRHTTAMEIVEYKPNVWKVLENHRLSPEDLNDEDMTFRIKLWMMIVFAAFWQPIETLPRYVLSIEAAMRQAGQSEDVITKLTLGKTLCALLQPQLVSDPVKHRRDTTWPFWCYGMGGWLDRSDIDELIQRLAPLKEFFNNHPESEENLEIRPARAYWAAMQMLFAAQQSRQGLFLTVEI